MSDWSRPEVEAAITDYLGMLEMELRGEPFNKAEHNRNLQRLLNGRTKGSIERKHQNISAILIEFGYPYIDGYKPLGNYQELLREVIVERLAAATALEQTVASVVEAPPQQVCLPTDILAMEVPIPETNRATERSVYERPAVTRIVPNRNYLEIEARNTALGLAGEQLVLLFEHERLWRAGQRTLADRITQVSVSQGDAVGYDISSFETDGRDRLIEVKTTRFGALTPFFASRNEVETSHICDANFRLYRLFKFSAQPQLFMVPGSLRRSCHLDAITFTARLA